MRQAGPGMGGWSSQARLGRRGKMTDLHVIIDTREQMPYVFPRASRGTLRTGDYSVRGLESEVCVERKSKADIYQSLSRARARFLREAVRMSKMRYAAIVIESSLPDLLIPPAGSAMSPVAVVASLISWSVRYRIAVFFAGDRLHGNALTLRILEWCARHILRSQERKEDGDDSGLPRTDL